MILDNDGELVWFRPLSDHATTKLRSFNLRVQHYRGQKVLTWFEGAVVSAHGHGRYAIADSSYRILRWVDAGINDEVFKAMATVRTPNPADVARSDIAELIEPPQRPKEQPLPKDDPPPVKKEAPVVTKKNAAPGGG